MDAAAYRKSLTALLPQGLAWPRLPDSNLGRLLQAIADELARLDASAEHLVVIEGDPRRTLDLLADWERAYGLPDVCSNQGDTLLERRNALVAKMTNTGGQSPAYYIAVAAALGFTVTITEFSPWNVGNAVNQPIYGTAWAYAWQISGPETTVRYWPVTGGVNEALADWGNELLECALTRVKPAHTYLLFAYVA